MSFGPPVSWLSSGLVCNEIACESSSVQTYGSVTRSGDT